MFQSRGTEYQFISINNLLVCSKICRLCELALRDVSTARSLKKEDCRFILLICISSRKNLFLASE